MSAVSKHGEAPTSKTQVRQQEEYSFARLGRTGPFSVLLALLAAFVGCDSTSTTPCRSVEIPIFAADQLDSLVAGQTIVINGMVYHGGHREDDPPGGVTALLTVDWRAHSNQ